MSPIDHLSITEKRQKLHEAVKILKELRNNRKLPDDLVIQGSVLYYLIIGIESILDIGTHILVEEYLARPDDYEDVIRLLNRHKIISPSLAKRSSGMAKFRNRVVHDYTKTDIKRIVKYLKEAPKQFLEFDHAFLSFLKKKKIR